MHSAAPPPVQAPVAGGQQGRDACGRRKGSLPAEGHSLYLDEDLAVWDGLFFLVEPKALEPSPQMAEQLIFFFFERIHKPVQLVFY